MAEHFCKEHDVAFTAKKGKEGDVFWSHKTEDGGWCNEPKLATKQKSKTPANDMTKEEWAAKDKLRADSIQIQNAYTGVPLMVELVNKYPDDPLARAAYQYAADQLSGYYQGATKKPDAVKSTEQMITDEQVERLKKAGTKYQGVENMKVYTELMKKAYKTTSFTKLNALQAEDLIKRLEKGEGLKQPNEIEPEELPF